MRIVSLNSLFWDCTSNVLNMKVIHHSLQFVCFTETCLCPCRAAELMTRTGSVVTLEVAKQGSHLPRSGHAPQPAVPNDDPR